MLYLVTFLLIPELIELSKINKYDSPDSYKKQKKDVEIMIIGLSFFYAVLLLQILAIFTDFF